MRRTSTVLGALFAAALPLLAQQPAVVTGGVENLYLRPDTTSPVEDQVVLGESVEVLEETAGFAKVRAEDGEIAWLPLAAFRRGTYEPARGFAEVISPIAHVYREPDVTLSRPLLTAPLGSRLRVLETLESGGHGFLRVELPDGRTAFVVQGDTRPWPEKRALGTPADWISFATRFLEAPYTWGGTTPLGFDCSGLLHRTFRNFGVMLKRNSSAQCFREPQLVPVAFEELQPGDLLYFGTENRIDHTGMWLGEGKLLQATAWDVPATKISVFAESPRLKERFRYARRLAALPTARKPGAPGAAKLGALKARLEALAAADGFTYGIVFEDLGNGEWIRLRPNQTMHAASTIKTAVMLELMRQVDQGARKLTDEILATRTFPSAVDGSPFDVEIDPETELVVAAKLGQKVSLGFLMKEMVARSSNIATNLLLTVVSPAEVQRTLDAEGAGTTRLRRAVEDEKAFEKGLNNETDADGLAALLKACLRSPRFSPEARRLMWETLAAQVWNEQIPAGLHPQSGAVVAHKTGFISRVQHDSALVRLPDGREYVLVLLATDFGANAEGRKKVYETTRKMSRAVWEHMVAP